MSFELKQEADRNSFEIRLEADEKMITDEEILDIIWNGILERKLTRQSFQQMEQ